MKNEYQKAKVTIELEDGQKVEFAAALRTRERNYFDLPPPGLDGRWNGVKLPDPPKWNFEGTTLGEIALTLP